MTSISLCDQQHTIMYHNSSTSWGLTSLAHNTTKVVEYNLWAPIPLQMKFKSFYWLCFESDRTCLWLHFHFRFWWQFSATLRLIMADYLNFLLPHTPPCSSVLPGLVSSLNQALMLSRSMTSSDKTLMDRPLMNLLLQITIGLPVELQHNLLHCDVLAEFPELMAGRKLQQVSSLHMLQLSLQLQVVNHKYIQKKDHVVY